MPATTIRRIKGGGDMMQDLISRQAAIDAIRGEIEINGYSHVVDVLEQLPSAQPEIIRCKDCKFCRQEIDMCDEPYSTAHNVVHEDDFCSKAERKEHE